MMHIRVDHEALNSKRRFACGIGPELPEGDKHLFEDEINAAPYRLNRIDCPRCNPEGPKPLGTPLSEVSGRPGHPGYKRFKQIAESWGYP